jgi:hypothetical protein
MVGASSAAASIKRTACGEVALAIDMTLPAFPFN